MQHFYVFFDRDVENSSYLSVFEEYIFGISELEGNSYIHMFKKNLEKYSLIDTKLIKGGSLCYIQYLPKNRALVGACYESGEIFSIEVGENAFGKMVSFIKQGDNKTKVTRAHCVVSNKSETILYSANIALDTIFSYKIKHGKYIYAANRGANTIAVFSVFEDGNLKNIGDCSCFGDWPRYISLVNKDKFLAIANQGNNQVILSKIDSKTGLLTDEIIEIAFNKPSFVCEGR